MRSVLVKGVVGAALCVGALGAWAGVSSASPAVHAPAQDFPPIFPAEGITPDGSLGGAPVVGNCPAYLFGAPGGTNSTDAVGFVFSSGAGVLYQLATPGDPNSASGGNVEGIATLIVGDNSSPFISPYSGQTHLWFGSNSNANGQSYFGETISFHGVTADGLHSITITANPGGIVSASGNESGWGRAKVTCT